MKKYMLMIRGEGEWDKLSADEVQETLKKYGAWARRLKEENRLVDAEPLDRTGWSITSEGVEVLDGPFVETKEMIGGYYIYTAATLAEAIVIARDCPALGYGGSIELRPIADYS